MATHPQVPHATQCLRKSEAASSGTWKRLVDVRAICAWTTLHTLASASTCVPIGWDVGRSVHPPRRVCARLRAPCRRRTRRGDCSETPGPTMAPPAPPRPTSPPPSGAALARDPPLHDQRIDCSDSERSSRLLSSAITQQRTCVRIGRQRCTLVSVAAGVVRRCCSLLSQLLVVHCDETCALETSRCRHGAHAPCRMTLHVRISVVE